LHCGAKRVAAFLATLDPLLADPVASRAALIAGVDRFLDDAVELLSTVARFGVPAVEPWIAAGELAELLGVSTDWVYEKAASGELPSHVFGGHRRFACPRWRRGRSSTRLADGHCAAGGERRADGTHSKAPYVGWCAFRCLLA
jgi:excisionase family DNA binding protein